MARIKHQNTLTAPRLAHYPSLQIRPPPPPTSATYAQPASSVHHAFILPCTYQPYCLFVFHHQRHNGPKCSQPGSRLCLSLSFASGYDQRPHRSSRLQSPISCFHRRASYCSCPNSLVQVAEKGPWRPEPVHLPYLQPSPCRSPTSRRFLHQHRVACARCNRRPITLLLRPRLVRFRRRSRKRLVGRCHRPPHFRLYRPIPQD